MTNAKSNNGSHPKHLGGWQTKLKLILDTNNTMKVRKNGQTSHRTREKRADMLFHMFRELRAELNYKIEDPANLKKKHIEALVKYWIDEKLTPETIDNKLSVLRTLCTWMNKADMVLTLDEYAPDLKRTYAAQTDKSWVGHDIDFWEVWDKVNAKSQSVAMQLLLVGAFGARLAEAVNFKPFIHGANDLYIELYDGTKGARPRIQPVDTEFKRLVISTLKDFVKSRRGTKKDHISDPEKTLEQNKKKYSNTMTAVGLTKKELGTTGPRLRAEFVIDELAKRGVTAPIVGGAGKTMSVDDTELVYRLVSEQLGHSRKSVMSAYCGAFRVDQLKANQPAEVKERLNWKDDAVRKLAERTCATKKF